PMCAMLPTSGGRYWLLGCPVQYTGLDWSARTRARGMVPGSGWREVSSPVQSSSGALLRARGMVHDQDWRCRLSFRHVPLSGQRLIPTRVTTGSPVRVVLINAEESLLTIGHIANPLTPAVLGAAIRYFDYLAQSIFDPRETTRISQPATSADVPTSATVC